MELTYLLEGLGLSKQESIVYITTLKLGVAKASQIAQKSEIKRGGVYYTLKLLKEKGYVHEVIKSGVVHYSAVQPKRLFQIIEEEREKKKSLLEEALPELINIHRISIEKPNIEVYEGYAGFKSIFAKLLEKQSQHIRCYMSSKILEFIPHFHTQFRKRRAQRNIHIRTITERTPLLEEIQKLDKREKRETRFNDKLLKNTELLHYILKDAVIIIKANKKEQLAFYIQDKNLAQLYENIFDFLWGQSKK